jgi:hypothetical protein
MSVKRRVVLIHGPPACGKLTTARAFAECHDTVILHNHLTFNLARRLFDVGDQRLVDLHRALRLVMLRHALAETPRGAEPVPDITLTLVYAVPDSVANVTEIVRLIESSGAELRPYYLQCGETALLARVVSADRAAEGKLQSAEKLETLLRQKRYPPLPHPDTQIIDNEDRSPASVAREIAADLAAAEPS